MMRFVEDLWSPLAATTPPPLSRLVAQTDAGVTDAVDRFVLEFVCDAEQASAMAALVERRLSRKRGLLPISFSDEFLHLAGLTKEGLLVITSKGGAVRSVSAHKGQARGVLKLDEARALFQEGTIAVVVDFEEQRTVTAYALRLQALSLNSAALPAHSAARAEAASSPGIIALLKASREALLNGTWALNPCRSASEFVVPSTPA